MTNQSIRLLMLQNSSFCCFLISSSSPKLVVARLLRVEIKIIILLIFKKMENTCNVPILYLKQMLIFKINEIHFRSLRTMC